MNLSAKTGCKCEEKTHLVTGHIHRSGVLTTNVLLLARLRRRNIHSRHLLMDVDTRIDAWIHREREWGAWGRMVACKRRDAHGWGLGREAWRHHVRGRAKGIAPSGSRILTLEWTPAVESVCVVLGTWLDVEALMVEDGLELVEIEVWVVLAEEVAALDELALDVLDVPSWCESLPVSVFLVALYACRLASGAAGML